MKVSKAGDFDEDKHPRAPDGKFGGGGGSGSSHDDATTSARMDDARAGAESAHIYEARSAVAAKYDAPLRDITPAHLPASAHAEASAKGESAAAAKGAEIEHEKAQIAAGHIAELPTTALDNYHAKVADIGSAITETRHELESAQIEATHAIASVSALKVEGPDGLIDEDLHDVVDDLPEQFDAPSHALGNEAPDHGSVEHQPKDGDYKPDESALGSSESEADAFEPESFEPDDDASDEDNAKAKTEHAAAQKEGLRVHGEAEATYAASHQEALATHRREVIARLGAAQDSLEKLHETQVATAAKLTAHEKAYDRLRDPVDKETETDPSKLVRVPKDSPDHASALAAATTLAEHQRREREKGLDSPIDFEEAHHALKESTKATAQAIKRLAKITGRPAKLASKPKKSIRPGADESESVASMARNILRLSALKFISLVDQPAQQTANFRVIKRKGRDRVEVKATAQIVKIDGGESPLVHCWAFTCTDENGQPYHDLQDDAVAPDYIKAAEAFMRDGAAVDEMHDGRQTNRIAFAYPMDSDVARGMFGDAIGKQLKTSGLMVAIRPTADALAKIRSGAYTGVSIAGFGTREVAKGKPPWLAGKDKKTPKRVGKSVVATSVEEGHAHTIDLCAPSSCWNSLSTSYQTSESDEQSHAHAWTYDVTGAVTILPDSGHTHTVDGTVSAETMAAATEKDDKDDEDEDEDEDGAPYAVEDHKSGPTVIVVAARAPTAVSTPSAAVPTVKSTTQENQTMDPKIAKMIAVALLLPESQRAHVAKLATDDLPSLQAFMSLDAAGRESATAAALAADPVMYTTKSGGQIRKSHGELAKSQAEQLDRQADLLATQTEALTVSKAQTEIVELEKRAAELIPMIGKSAAVRVALLRGASAVTDETLRGDIIEALKGANAAFASMSKAQGTDGGSGPSGTDPKSIFNTALSTFAKSISKSDVHATGDFLRTQHGAELYADAYPRNQV